MITEDLFGTSMKLEEHENLLLKSIVSFMFDYYNIKAKVIIKKKITKGLIGDVALNTNSVSNHKFYLHYNPNQSYQMQISSVIHEMTHVKQIVNKELLPSDDYKSIMWEGEVFISAKNYAKLMKTDIKGYMELPWEKEAYSNMKLLYPKFISSKYFINLKGKNKLLDIIIDNI